MNKGLERFLSAAALFSVAASAMTAYPVQAQKAESVSAVLAETDEDSGAVRHFTESGGDSQCIIYKPEDDGKISLDLNRYDLSFNCTWSDVKRADFSVFTENGDKLFDTDKFKMYYLKYSADIDCSDSFAFGALFNCYEESRLSSGEKKEEFTEVRILESYSDIDVISENNMEGSIKVGGVDYNIYRTTETIDAVTANILIIARAESLAADSAISGTLDIKAFCDELKKKNYKLTYPKGLQTVVQSYGKSGSAIVNINELVSMPYPNKIDVPDNSKNGKIAYRDGYSYIFWKNDDKNSSNMLIEKDGEALCNYNNPKQDSDCIFRKGITKKNGIKFSNAEIKYCSTLYAESDEDVYAVGVNYSLGDPMTNFFIVNYRKSDSFVENAELIGDADINGVEYQLYKKELKNFITDTGKPYTEYWCVTSVEFADKVYGMRDVIEIADYIDAWKKAGIDAGDRLYEVSAFAEFFGKGKGDFKIQNVDINIDEPGKKTVLTVDSPYFDKDGYRYYSEGNGGSCIVESNGDMVGESFYEHDGETYSFGKGIEFGSVVDTFNDEELRLEYKANVSSDNHYQLGAEGTMRGLNNEPYIKYHIIDRTNYDYVPETAEYLGQKLIGGEMFELYADHTHDQYKPGGRSIDEYYSIRKEYSGSHENYSGIIYVNEHIKAWKEADLTVGGIESIYLDMTVFNKGDAITELYDTSFVVLRNDDDSADYTAEDVKLLTKFLLGEKCDIIGKNYDLNSDGVWDTFDLIMLKRRIADNSEE